MFYAALRFLLWFVDNVEYTYFRLRTGEVCRKADGHYLRLFMYI